MNPNKMLWEKGDFTRIARHMRDSGTAFVDTLGISPAMKVLDLGCGDGTTALPAARLGAEVLGVDIAANLVAAGQARAVAENLGNLRFQEGDAADLGSLASQSFDLVVTVFGAMFAPRPHDVAREMVRVTKPGGRIVMGNWVPGDPTLVAQILKTCSAYTPPPPDGFVSPMLWGVEAEVVDRFTSAGVPKENIDFQRSLFTFRYPGPPQGLLDEFLDFYGPTMNAVEAAEKAGKATELREELRGLFERQNSSAQPDVTEIAANYLRVTVTLP